MKNLSPWSPKPSGRGQPLTYDFSVIAEKGVTTFAGAVHHFMARGDRREQIFRDERDRWKFLGYLAEGGERFRVKVHCYDLMENHFHQVATEPKGNLSKWMHQLKTAYTVYFNRRHQVVGHLFSGQIQEYGH
jgi:putative transposase